MLNMLAAQYPISLVTVDPTQGLSEQLKIRHDVPPRRRLPLLGPSGLCESTSLSCASSLSLST